MKYLVLDNKRYMEGHSKTAHGAEKGGKQRTTGTF